MLRSSSAVFGVAALVLCASPSFAADPWVARPLTLPAWGFSGDVGLGVGRTTTLDPAPTSDTPVGTQKPGAGLNVEAALGLPHEFEVGVRIGVRFQEGGALTNADAYGRLYDPLSLRIDAGTQSFANPEFRIVESLVDVPVVAVGVDIRLIPGFAPGSSNILMPGVPLRFRGPHRLRIDTGFYFPITFVDSNTWGLEIPVAVWFQVGSFFAGPLSGFYWNNPPSGDEAHAGVPRQVDINAGLGLGYTVAGVCDLKAQVLTTRLTDPGWAKYIGGGLGVGFVVR